MSSETIEELREFHRFLGEKLANGPVDCSPEEALDEWRRLHPDSHACDEELPAIQEALGDMEQRDRGTLFEEFDRDFRNRHSLSGAAMLVRAHKKGHKDVEQVVKEMLEYRDRQKRTLGGISIRELIDEGRRY